MAKSWLPDSGNFMPMDRGWDGWVKSPAISPDAEGKRANQANGVLSFADATGTTQMIGLWVNNIQLDFAMGGQNVQSKTRRSFFPHNFVAPVTQFSGQCPNQYEYNRLSQFIRQAQLNYARGVVLNGGKGLRLQVFDAANHSTSIHRRQRGSHEDFDAYGYILNAPAGAERWVNAPEYTFEFTVTDIVSSFLNAIKDDVQQQKNMESATGLFLAHPGDFVSGKDLKPTPKKPKAPKRNHKEHQGHGLPPQDINNPFLHPELNPVQIQGDGITIPSTDTGTNPSGG